MAEPLCMLSLDRVYFLDLFKRCERNDDLVDREAALAEMRGIWDHGLPILCASPVPQDQDSPVFAQIIADVYDPCNKLLAMALCSTCRDKPTQLHFSRCLKVLKSMVKARTGKTIHFQRYHYR